jgi:serine/threonine protein kinase/tetratricopeptide (TPR) repeat protein
MGDDQLLDAAGRIADGEMLDWGSITSTLSSAHEREIAEELALVQQIAAGHRQLHQLLPVATDTPPHLIPDRARWGHLDLLNVVGRGSYGMVYRAWDTRLERLVALKLFHGASNPDSVMQEGRMLARVRHENVVTVYGADVFDGVAGIWMELIHGQTLDTIVKKTGPLPPADAALVGADVARALGAIHAAGLLHCDVKAQNVVRENGGRVVLMDLGAGRLAPEARDSDQVSDVAGTPRYMAPELFASGADATKASDIYSLGVLIYYLVSGRFPVDGKTLGELKRAHEEGKARSLKSVRSDVPKGLLELVARTIDPDPQARPPTTSDVQAALTALAVEVPTEESRSWSARWIVAAAILVALTVLSLSSLLRPSPAATPAVQSIAVLPIRNLTGDPAKAYVADGLTEVLISNLARIRSLRVPSFAAVAAFRDSPEHPGEISRRLGVQLLLAGSITQADSRVRFNVQLIDANGTAIWGEEIDRDSPGVMAAQAQIARHVAERLSLDTAVTARAGQTQAALNPKAQDAYLQGLALAYAGPTRAIESVRFFREAAELAPAFAPAWAELSLAESRLLDASVDADDRPARARDVIALAQRSIEIDPELSVGHAALANARFYYEWNFVDAERLFRKSLELDPSNAFARQRLAMLLAALKRVDEAVALGREARDLEPALPVRSTSLGILHYYRRDYVEAAREMRHALDLLPDYPVAHFGLGRVLLAQGQVRDAIAEFESATARDRAPAYLIELVLAYTVAGRADDAARVMSEIVDRERQGQGFNLDRLAYLEIARGRIDEAFALLERAREQRMANMLWIAVDPRVDGIRSDPRFNRLVTQMGIQP